MLGSWNRARRCCFWLVPAVFLTACAADLGDTFDVGPFMREQITGDSWRACLAREYQTQARIQLRAGRHWTEASALAAKGQAALDNQPTGPGPSRPALAHVRTDLELAIVQAGNNPCECAKVQARYDGWSAAIDRKMDTAPFAKAFGDAVKTCTASR